MTLAFATHVANINDSEFDGIGNSLEADLALSGIAFIRIKHSMDGSKPSTIQLSESKDSFGFLLRPIGNQGVRYFAELIATISWGLKSKPRVFIGVDPLNALAGIILRKLGATKVAVFYTADYSDRRFTNRILNWLYHLIDRFCARNADEVWSVSAKICAIRNRIGVEPSRNIFIPNVPPQSSRRYECLKRNKYALTMNGILDVQLDFEGAIRAVARLAEIHDVELHIIGTGPDEQRLFDISRELALESRVFFHGKRSLSDTMELTAQCGLGLALYTGAWAFNLNGDSTKCREYMSFSLPVITTMNHSTAQEIVDARAGVSTELSVEGYFMAIQEVLGDYDNYSKAAFELGHKYDGVRRGRITSILESSGIQTPIEKIDFDTSE